MSYHTPPGIAMDITVDHKAFLARHRRIVDGSGRTVALIGEPSWFFAPLPPDPRRPRTSSAARTRSARWQAGTRRTRRLARRPGPSPAPADPMAGWQDLGWISQDGVETSA